MMQITPTVKQLLIINILFFIGSQMVGEQAYNVLSLFFFENDKFQYWQPLSHMFMHGGIMHIVFNMFALYSFGSALEHFWGGKKFLFFYISCGLGSAILHTLVNYLVFHQGLNTLIEAGFKPDEIYGLLNQEQMDTRWIETLGNSGLQNFTSAFASPAVGASGAIYGLLVAFAFMVPNAELALMFIPVPIKAKYFVPGLLCLDLFLGLKGNSIFGGGTGIAHFAHIGGALVGFLMMWYWKKDQFRNNRWN
ncbi:rhomboid family intramembrane serine protease [Flavobacterium sp. CYK-4]|uniref:rhomboid family intramembrane serine protease n=1 Tax=Flavobacterium lotistagni TaxID=2709660 RepID=UPI001A9CA5E6|nr:rhomboid family intramembrane serine protease [Flavobacterium lotistagni]NHM06166.1 rhomboid family intramembrane serine protease [Flavobacterium lotistagni]